MSYLTLMKVAYNFDAHVMLKINHKKWDSESNVKNKKNTVFKDSDC